MRNLNLTLAGLAVSASLVGCGQSSGTSSSSSSMPAVFDVNTYALNKLVCDPLSSGAGSSSTDPNFSAGIKADLYYLNAGQAPFTDVESFINQGAHADQFLFFSSIDVPTRLFNQGFPTMSGGLIADDAGDTLFENFALRFTTVLQLAPTDAEGTYEFALLADDGAILKLKNGDGGYQIAVNDDGDHPTQMGCSTYRINMTHQSQVLMQLDYFQGPRYEIAAIPMWRKVVAGQVSPDPLCGQNGNYLYFDPDHGSVPLQAYNDLLSRSWKPIAQANYTLPQGVLFNPCQGGVAPVITQFSMDDDGNGNVVAHWTTDIASTSQLRIVDVASGVEQLTLSDNSLSLVHSASASALKVGHQYLFQGVSISDSYGKALSSAITLLLQ